MAQHTIFNGMVVISFKRDGLEQRDGLGNGKALGNGMDMNIEVKNSFI